MKIWATLPLLVLLAGCGADPGGGGGDAGDPCRAPAGCTATIRESPRRCLYSCPPSDAGRGVGVCVPLADGGVSQADFSPAGVPVGLLETARPPTASDLVSDLNNCTRCGNRCAPGELCRFARPGVPGGCYVP